MNPCSTYVQLLCRSSKEVASKSMVFSAWVGGCGEGSNLYAILRHWSPALPYGAILHTHRPFYVPKPQQINKSLQKYVVHLTLLKTHSNCTLCSFFSSSLRKTHTCKKPFSVSSPLNVSAFGLGLGFWIKDFLFHLSLCLSVDILLLLFFFFFGFFV